ncbi:MAG: alpha/beta fold hydrolase [Gaiellaceae bacterium]
MRRRRAGHGDARRAAELTHPLLLIAGLGQGAWAWRDVVPLLDRPAITFDNGGTGSLNDRPARRTIEDLADDALAQADGPSDIVGLSMGGYVAMTIALTRPASVRRLVLAGTGAGGPDRVRRPKHVADAFTSALRLPYPEYARRTMPYTFAEGWGERNPERFEEILAVRLEQPTPYSTIEAHAEACYAFYRAGCPVERVAAPTLVIHGSEDVIVPVENGRMLAERIPGARYVELPGRGHNLPLEEPETFAALVNEFLQ